MNKQKRNQKQIEALSFKEKMVLLTKADNSNFQAGSLYTGQVGRSRPKKKR
jgi:hypothetical protein